MNLPLVRIGAFDCGARHAWLGSVVRGRQWYGCPLSHMTYLLAFLLHLFRVAFLDSAAAGRPDSAHKSEFHLQNPFWTWRLMRRKRTAGYRNCRSGRHATTVVAETSAVRSSVHIAVRLSCPRRTMSSSNPHTHCHVIIPIFHAVPEFPSTKDPLLTHTHGVPNCPCATS